VGRGNNHKARKLLVNEEFLAYLLAVMTAVSFAVVAVYSIRVLVSKKR